MAHADTILGADERRASPVTDAPIVIVPRDLIPYLDRRNHVVNHRAWCEGKMLDAYGQDNKDYWRRRLVELDDDLIQNEREHPEAARFFREYKNA